MGASPVTVYNLNDIMEVQIMGKLYGDWNMNVLCFRVKQTQIFTSGIREHLQGLVTNFRSNCSQYQVWSKFRHRRLRPLPVTDYGEYDWTGTTGASSSHAMPAQVAAVWQIKTALNAPAGRGRFYLPGVALDAWSANNWTLGAYSTKNGLKAFIEQWFRIGGDSEYIELGVCSRQTSPVAYNGMKTVDYASYAGVQRSRRPFIV